MSTVLEQQLLDNLNNDAKEVWPDNFSEIEEMFNSCCYSICVETIKQLGLFQKKGEFETLDTIKNKIKVFKDAEYVLTKVLEILCEVKVLKERDGGFECLDDDPDIETPAESLVIAVRKFPEECAPFQWLARAHDGLVKFINGKLYAEEVMFPWNDFTLVEEVYNTSNVYGFYSKLAGKAIKRIINECYDSKVTLLEIGAGTGNGTRNVLKEIDDKFEKYIFTDVSKALVQRSGKKFKKTTDYDFIEFRDLDISKNLEEDEIVKADIVLAVNVIHATDEISITIKNMHKLLKKGGILILSELMPPPDGLYRYMELTFGLLPSFSAYNDKDIRPVSPLIRPEVWCKEFEKSGFTEIKAVPENLPGVDRGGIIIGIK